MTSFVVLNGSQTGASHCLGATASYLFGSSEEDDFVFADAGKARVMARSEGSSLTLTALSGPIKVNGQALAQGSSVVAEMPVQLDLDALCLKFNAADTTSDAGPKSIQATAQAKPQGPRLVTVLCLAFACIALYFEYTASALDHDYQKQLQVKRSQLIARWENRADVNLIWGTVSSSGSMKVNGFVPNNTAEQELRTDVRQSGLLVDLGLTNYETLTQEASAMFQQGGELVKIAHVSSGSFVMNIESSHWPSVKKKMASLENMPEGIRQINVSFSDVWLRSSGQPLVLQFDRKGPMDELSRNVDLESIALPAVIKQSLAAVQLRPTPALVTHRKERILQGAVLANGVELLAIDKDWITMARNGIVRRQRLG
jgi:hypothetical protein